MGRKSRNAGKKKTRVQPEKVATEYSESDRKIKNIVLRQDNLYPQYLDSKRCTQQDIEKIKLHLVLKCPITTNLENFWKNICG